MQNNYRRKAEECRGFAEQAVDSATAHFWLALAAQWLRLAEYVGDSGEERSLDSKASGDARTQTLEARLDKIQRFWDEEKAFARVVASGRYVKLCEATQKALEALDKALRADDPSKAFE